MRIRLIAFTGKMGSGKSTAAQIIKNSGHTRIHKFAQPLYDMQDYIYKRVGIPLAGKDRTLLQYLGTEWGRTKDPELWVNLWKKEVATTLEDTDAVVVCDDCRFPNEAAAVKALGGVVVEVVTSVERIEKINAGHVSESGLSNEQIDYRIENDGDIDDLRDKIMHIFMREWLDAKFTG
jgi:hypothetical protein